MTKCKCKPEPTVVLNPRYPNYLGIAVMSGRLGFRVKAAPDLRMLRVKAAPDLRMLRSDPSGQQRLVCTFTVQDGTTGYRLMLN